MSKEKKPIELIKEAKAKFGSLKKVECGIHVSTLYEMKDYALNGKLSEKRTVRGMQRKFERLAECLGYKVITRPEPKVVIFYAEV